LGLVVILLSSPNSGNPHKRHVENFFLEMLKRSRNWYLLELLSNVPIRAALVLESTVLDDKYWILFLVNF